MADTKEAKTEEKLPAEPFNPKDKVAKIDFSELDYDPLKVEGKDLEPDKHFCWGSSCNKDQYNRYLAMGFRPVDAKTSKVTVQGVDKQIDTTIRVGDAILMEMPRQRREAIERMEEQKRKAMGEGHKKEFRQIVEQAERELRDHGHDPRKLLIDERER
jgi:hypothetical protein